MKTKTLLLPVALGIFSVLNLRAAPLETAFTYQGKISDGGTPATGWYDFAFTIHADAIHPIPLGTAAVLNGVAVSNGLFTVQLNSAGEFGSEAFNGQARWLQIGVRTNSLASLGAPFTMLMPRQPLTAAPEALFALEALRASTVAAGSINSASIAAGAIGALQLAAGAVDSSKIADGSIATADIAAGAITPALLAKPYQSASLGASVLSAGFGPAEFTNIFAPAFAATPVVTASLESGRPDFAGTVQAWVNSKSAAGFSFTIQRAVGPAVELDFAEFTALEHVSEGAWSLTGMNDRPAVAYGVSKSTIVESSSSLVYRASLNPAGTVWSKQIAATNVDVGSSSVGVVNGNPAIAIADSLAGRVQFVRALDTNGLKWAAPVTVDAAIAGGELSLAVVDGQPAISYYDSALGVLKFARAMNVNGTAWDAPRILDAGGNAGRFTTLLVVNGYPAISYYDVTGKNLRYMRATDASGAAAWSAPVTIESALDVGKFASLAVVNGRPALAYLQSDFGQVKYNRALDVDGTSWSAGQIIATNASPSALSLVSIGARPAVAFQSGTSTSYVAARDADGIAWTVQSVVNAGSANVLMGVVKGAPFVLDTHYNLATQRTSLNVTTTLGGNVTLNWIALQP